MKDPDVAGFIEAYEALCNKYNLYIDIQVDDTLAVFKVNEAMDERLRELKKED